LLIIRTLTVLDGVIFCRNTGVEPRAVGTPGRLFALVGDESSLFRKSHRRFLSQKHSNFQNFLNRMSQGRPRAHCEEGRIF